eukprot:Rhum_TRINITY_DN18743_c0_g1::Rhum_TRINITY_DN18743_c0_g1_i1::g.168178::m.168178/K13124/MORG1; mitogen-activated protein kinase organizer 1
MADSGRRIDLPSRARLHLREQGTSGTVNSVRYNDGGQYAVSGGSDKVVRLWNTDNGTLVKTYRGGTHDVGCVLFSGDSERIVACGGEKAINIWDVSEGSVVQRKLRGHQARVNAVCWSADGALLVSGSHDATVKIWDMRSAHAAQSLQTLTAPGDAVTAVAVREEVIYAASVDGFVRTYDVRAGSLASDCLGPPIGSLTPSEDGRLLLASCLDSSLKLLDTSSGAVVATFDAHVNAASQVRSTLTPSNEYAVTGSESDGVVFFYDVVKGSVAHTLRHAQGDNFGDTQQALRSVAVPALDYHPSKAEMITGGSDGFVVVFE